MIASRTGPIGAALALALGAAVALVVAGCGGSGSTTSAITVPTTTTPPATTPATTTAAPTTPAPTKKPKTTSTATPTTAAPPAASGAASVSGSGPQSDRAAILAALPALPYPKSSYRLDVRVSKRSPTWAAVYIKPAPGYENQIQADAASFTKSGGSWKVHEVGNGGGCGVPASVRTELKLACY